MGSRVKRDGNEVRRRGRSEKNTDGRWVILLVDGYKRSRDLDS